MGDDVSATESTGTSPPLVLRLDEKTDALVRDIILTLSGRHPDLLAIILYGSAARHEERPLNDPHPSDVDLLLVFDTDDEHVAINQGYGIFASLGLARCRHLDAPREVQVMVASRTLREWDPTFVEHVAHDGGLLFARGPLPEPFATLGHPTAGGQPI